jgi:hypothetical protein
VLRHLQVLRPLFAYLHLDYNTCGLTNALAAGPMLSDGPVLDGVTDFDIVDKWSCRDGESGAAAEGFGCPPKGKFAFPRPRMLPHSALKLEATGPLTRASLLPLPLPRCRVHHRVGPVRASAERLRRQRPRGPVWPQGLGPHLVKEISNALWRARGANGGKKKPPLYSFLVARALSHPVRPTSGAGPLDVDMPCVSRGPHKRRCFLHDRRQDEEVVERGRGDCHDLYYREEPGGDA